MAEERIEVGSSPLLRVLSSVGFWLFVAYIGLAFVVLWLFLVSGARRRDTALHRGEVIADARSKVNACILSRPQFRKIDNFVDAVLIFHVASYENAEAIVRATSTTDPTYETRVKNAARIAKTIPPIRAIHFDVPTVKQCLALGVTRYGKVAPTVPIRPIAKKSRKARNS